MGRISTSPRYVIYITGLNPRSFGELGGGVKSENLEKIEIFLTYERVTLLFRRNSCLRALMLNTDQIW